MGYHLSSVIYEGVQPLVLNSNSQSDFQDKTGLDSNTVVLNGQISKLVRFWKTFFRRPMQSTEPTNNQQFSLSGLSNFQ